MQRRRIERRLGATNGVVFCARDPPESKMLSLTLARGQRSSHSGITSPPEERWRNSSFGEDLPDNRCEAEAVYPRHPAPIKRNLRGWQDAPLQGAAARP